MGRANGHGRGIRRHCHRSLVCQAVGQESLRGQAEDRCSGILVLFAERLFLLWVENEYPHSEEVPLQAVLRPFANHQKVGKMQSAEQNIVVVNPVAAADHAENGRCIDPMHDP